MGIYPVLMDVMGAASFTVAVSELFIHFRSKGIGYGIDFGITALCTAGYCLMCAGQYNVATSAQSIPWLHAQAAFLNLMALFFLRSIRNATNMVPALHLRIITVWFLLGAAVQAVGFGDLTWVASRPIVFSVSLPFRVTIVYRLVDGGIITDIQSLFAVGYFAYLFCVLVSFGRAGNWRKARTMIIVVAILSAAIANDFALDFRLYSSLYLTEYAWIAAIVLVGFDRSQQVIETARARAALAESLEEKNLLIKEIHHRVKNNLQVISSLLWLQEGRAAEPYYRDILRDCRNQILSMALIHEDLYRSVDFRNVEFGEYVRNLVGRLLNSVARTERIRVALDVESVFLPIDQAIPCGLILNELCTNALKYAFPGDPNPPDSEIRVSLHEQSKRVRLEVADNGVGLPKDFDLHSDHSLGMQIVSTLARQLKGTVSQDATRGTRFVVEFPTGGA